MTGRAGDAVLHGLLALLPPGWVWPREPDSNLAKVFRPLAEGVARLEGSAEALVAEADPRAAVELLADYERVLGPDGCAGDVALLSRADRAAVAHQRWIARGGQSPAYFIGLAAALGTAISITEQRQMVCGLAVCGDVLTPHGEQFVWIVGMPADRLIDAECGVSECGDLLGDIVGNVAECVIRAGRPAHTEVVFSYA